MNVVIFLMLRIIFHQKEKKMKVLCLFIESLNLGHLVFIKRAKYFRKIFCKINLTTGILFYILINFYTNLNN